MVNSNEVNFGNNQLQHIYAENESNLLILKQRYAKKIKKTDPVIVTSYVRVQTDYV